MQGDSFQRNLAHRRVDIDVQDIMEEGCIIRMIHMSAECAHRYWNGADVQGHVNSLLHQILRTVLMSPQSPALVHISTRQKGHELAGCHPVYADTSNFIGFASSKVKTATSCISSKDMATKIQKAS